MTEKTRFIESCLPFLSYLLISFTLWSLFKREIVFRFVQIVAIDNLSHWQAGPIISISHNTSRDCIKCKRDILRWLFP